MTSNSTTDENRFRLIDTNWVEWEAYVERKLLLNDLDMYLEPPEIDAATNKAKTLTADKIRKAKKAFGLIRMHLTRKFLDMTEHCQTAYGFWTVLKNHFQKAEKNVKLFNIHKLVHMAKNPPPVEDLAMSIRATAAKLSEVMVNSDTFMVGFYTALLPSDYSDLRVTSLTSREKMTLTDAAEIVKNECDQKAGKQMVAAQARQALKFKRNDSKPDSDQLCTYCAKTNHTVDKCFFKKKAEALKQKLPNKAEDKFRVSAIVKKACGLTKRSDRDVWYLDSGSQSHTVNNDAGFVSLRQTKDVVLESAAGDDIGVEGIGAYRIRSRPNLVLELKDCIYAPSLIANFLLSGKLN